MGASNWPASRNWISATNQHLCALRYAVFATLDVAVYESLKLRTLLCGIPWDKKKKSFQRNIKIQIDDNYSTRERYDLLSRKAGINNFANKTRNAQCKKKKKK